MLKKMTLFFLFLGVSVLYSDSKGIRETISDDYKSFYSKDNMFQLAGYFAIGATMANTPIDQNIQDWYNDNIKSNTTDNFAQFAKNLGEGSYWIPLGLLASSLYYIDEDFLLSNWGLQVMRSYIVGAPFMLGAQVLTGASRPSDDNENNSYWRPFYDKNGVSGHAFIGTVPFVVIAKMSDSYLIKIPAYIASFLAAWSRINDNAHYASQVLLGWSIGYVSVESICKSGIENKSGFKLSSTTSLDNTPLIALTYSW